jgi:hypothetical protein
MLFFNFPSCFGFLKVVKPVQHLQLLSHPFIKRYEEAGVDLAAYVKGVVNPTERLKQIAEVNSLEHFQIFILFILS